MTMHKMPHTQAEIKIKKKLMELENNRWCEEQREGKSDWECVAVCLYGPNLE